MTQDTVSKHSGRSRICLAALEAFAQHGYDGAGVSLIAERAGVSQPSIHYHFKSKRMLWEAAMLQLAEMIDVDRRAQAKFAEFLSPLDKLKATCTILIENAASNPVLGQIILSEGQTGGERLDWLLRHVLSDVYYEFLEIIETCVQDGVIKPYKPSHVLMLLTGAAVTQFNVAPLVSSVFGDDPKSPDNVDAYKAMYLDVIFSGLINTDPEPCQD
ncbi:MAG: TetR/AcrR family transcriptional regulator [Henriciella sp.]|nr:TetR/AcrR family transcriptional regulator [Henriciella sp.]